MPTGRWVCRPYTGTLKNKGLLRWVSKMVWENHCWTTPRSPFLAKFGCPELRDIVTYCTPYFKIHTNTDWHFPLFASFKDGEHEGLFAVLLCRVVGGRTKVVTNNDINIASWYSLKVIWSMVSITQPCQPRTRSLFEGWLRGQVWMSCLLRMGSGVLSSMVHIILSLVTASRHLGNPTDSWPALGGCSQVSSPTIPSTGNLYQCLSLKDFHNIQIFQEFEARDQCLFRQVRVFLPFANSDLVTTPRWSGGLWQGARHL